MRRRSGRTRRGRPRAFCYHPARHRTQPAVNGGRTIVVGNDALADEVCRIRLADGHAVTVVWNEEPAVRRRAESRGCTFVAGNPRDAQVLLDAGVASAGVILALSQDDGTNLEVALEAREANPAVRIVLRQFNRALANKLEQNLKNCSVVSLAAHSAATYAAAALDPECFLGLEFPTGSRTLVGFSRRTARDLGVSSMGVADAEQRLDCRILAVNDGAHDVDHVLAPTDSLTLFGRVERLAESSGPVRADRRSLGWVATRVQLIAAEIDPLLRVLVAAGAAVFVVATLFFGAALHLNVLTAAYFVTTTMTTVGYGDIALADKGLLLQAAGMLLMIAGVVVANLAIAFVAAALIRAQWNALQGVRPIRHAGHVVVFGAGRVGTRIVDFLCALGASITVVERVPTPDLVARARARDISLLTGDGTLDATLDHCNVRAARSAVVVTDSDVTNLEIGLGARARRDTIPVIMRIAEPSFAATIRRQFAIRRTFSATTLAASTFCDLAGSSTARGRVTIGGAAFRLEECPSAMADRGGVLLAAARGAGPARRMRHWDEVAPGDVALVMSALSSGA